jgi:hypothetical protein
MTGLDILSIPSFLSIGLASVVAGVAARYYPFYADWVKEQRRKTEEAMHKQQATYQHTRMHTRARGTSDVVAKE